MHPPAESLLEASGQLQPAGPTAEDRLAVLRDKSPSLGAALAVSYTHLTLPTSDLV